VARFLFRWFAWFYRWGSVPGELNNQAILISVGVVKKCLPDYL